MPQPLFLSSDAGPLLLQTFFDAILGLCQQPQAVPPILFNPVGSPGIHVETERDDGQKYDD